MNNADRKQAGLVMVVDDQMENIRLLSKILSDENYRVTPAISGKEALTRIGPGFLPDLILLDIRMPEMDGYAVCKALKENKLTAEIPIIFLSASRETQSQIDGFKAGAVDYISKPIQQDELLARVNAHLTLSRSKTIIANAFRELEEVNHIAKLGKWTLDISTDHLECSKEIYTIFELELHEFDHCYEGFLSVIHPDDRDKVGDAYITSLQTGKPYEITHRLLMKDGRVKYLREQCRTDYSEDGVPLVSVGVVQDITEQVTTELKLQKAKDAADDANRAKSRFLANMSHEIRTPMNAILGFTENLENLEDNPQKKHFLKSISTAGQSLLTLINDILDLSKIEAGKLELHFSLFSVPALLNDINTIFLKKVTDKGLSLDIDIGSDMPEAISLDESRLRQILINLVGNAVKFTDSGKIRLAASVKKTDKHPLNHVELSLVVEDSGIGIPEDQQDTVFGAFVQRAEQSSSQFGGTGLGLSITKHLVTLMGGDIHIDSSFGNGATFRVTFPDVETATRETQVTKRQRDISKLKFEPATLLIVDDVAVNREVLSVNLKQFNFNLIYAENGLEALAQTRKNHPDLILLDMRMPEMDGYEVRAILKNDDELKNIPVIAVTASALKQDEEVITALCEGYLRKPIKRVDLLHELMRFIPHNLTDEPHDMSQPSKHTRMYHREPD